MPVYEDKWRLIMKSTEGERCRSCGKRYLTCWQANGDLWAKVTGKSDGSGLRCIECFEKEARAKGLILYWSCAEGEFPGDAEH